MKTVIIIASLIISISIFLAGGIYEFSSQQVGLANRYNKITGDIDLCRYDIGCERFGEQEDML